MFYLKLVLYLWVFVLNTWMLFYLNSCDVCLGRTIRIEKQCSVSPNINLCSPYCQDVGHIFILN